MCLAWQNQILNLDIVRSYVDVSHAIFGHFVIHVLELTAIFILEGVNFLYFNLFILTLKY